MGGAPFLISCKLIYNGLGVALKALSDTGANSFAFIDFTFAAQLCRFLDLFTHALDYSILIKKYDGKLGPFITRYLLLYLTIDGRKLLNIPFLILLLSNQNVILGRK